MAQVVKQKTQRSPRVGNKSPGRRQTVTSNLGAEAALADGAPDQQEQQEPAAPAKTISYSNGASYHGEVNRENQRHGQGTLTFANNEAVFTGRFEIGNMVEGKIAYPNQEGDCFFEGHFRNNSWYQGVYKRGTTTYEGTFENQKMDGEYKVTWASGIVYVGAVKNNKLEGQGVMTFAQGNIAEIKGVWRADELERCELLTMKNGATATNYNPKKGRLTGPGTVKVGVSTYVGTWDENGKLNGHVSIENDNGQGKFTGAFKDNQREGDGHYIWPNGQGEYTGLFQNGLRHTAPNGADATMIWRTGDTEHKYIGQWEYGQCTVGKLDGNPVDQRNV